MKLPLEQETALYELALNAEQSPHPLQASPATFKSFLGSAIDCLLEQKLPATLWIKLPSGDPWQAELNRYLEQAGEKCQVYVCNRSAADGMDSVEQISPKSLNTSSPFISNSTAADASHGGLIDDISPVAKMPARQTAVCSLPLAPDSKLKREYFLLVLSEQFCCLILAHRPRSIRGTPETMAKLADLSADRSAVDRPEDAIAPSADRTNLLNDDDRERKHPLLFLCSFDPDTIQLVLAGIKQALIHAQSHSENIQLQPEPDAIEPITLDTLLKDWETRFPVPQTLDAKAMSHFWMKQTQRHEKTWRSTTTYRKQAAATESIQLQNEELRKALHLNDEFLSNVCQELRTPLASMKTALTLLASPNLKSAQRQRYLDVLNTECDRQSSLISGLLELVQMDRAQQETETHPLHLSDIVPGVVSTFQPLANEKGIMLAYTIPEDLPPVSCLSAWVRQISINLLDNGIKFTEPGGQVWVRAKQQGDYVQLAFCDSGIGIPPKEIHKIFDRFYRVRHSNGDDSEGAGLGLSLVQQLLLRCGGSISVKSKPGDGSSFNVLLPIEQAVAEE